MLDSSKLALVTTHSPFDKLAWVILSGNQKKWVTMASLLMLAYVPCHVGQNSSSDTKGFLPIYATWGSCPSLQRDSRRYQKPLNPKEGRFFLPLLPDPVVKTYWLKVKHMPWAFLRDQTLMYFVASEKQAAGSDTAKLSHYSQGAGDPRETFPSHSSIHFHSFSTDLQMNGRTKHHARARQQKILLSVMLVDHCFKILAIILSFWWHFC